MILLLVAFLRSHVNRTCDSQSPNPSKERLRGNRQRIGGTRHDNEAGEVDNGLIKAPQEISRDSFDDVDGTAAVRVRFEIDGAEPKRNGVRCENGRQVDGAPRVLTKNPDANDNSRPERRPIAKQNRASGVNAEKKQESSLRRTDRVEVSKDEKDTNDERDYSRIIEEKPAIVDIVQCLVESR